MPMKAPSPSIFRPEALRRYRQNQEEPVLPPWISQRLFSLLWVLLAALLAVSFIVGFFVTRSLPHA